MKKILFILLLSFLSVFANENIGIVKKLSFELPGKKLKAAEVDEKAPARVRMILVTKTETGYRYELDFIGLEEGEYNVIDYLRTMSNEIPQGYKEIKVTVGSVLEDEFKGELKVKQVKSEAPKVWYSTLNYALLVVWFAVLLYIIFGRRPKIEEEDDEVLEAEPTTAEKLLKLLQNNDASSKENWQQIEGLLISHYFSESDSEEMMYEKIAELKSNSDSGPLIEMMETYLHSPNGKERVDLEELKNLINQKLGGKE